MKINDIKKLLNTLDKDTLIEIICAAAENDSEYGSELALKYGQQDADILDLCADRIRASLTLDIYTDTYDPAPIYDAYIDIAVEAQTIKDTVPLTAFNIYWQTGAMLTELYESAYDKDDYLSSCLDECFGEIDNIASSDNLSQQESEKIFEAMLDYFNNELKTDSEYGFTLAASAIAAVRTKEQKETIDAVLARKIQDLRRTKGSDAYPIDNLMQTRLSLIQRFDGDASAVKFAESNINIYGFRKFAADCALESKDWKHLLEIAGEGLEKGIRRDMWQEYMLKAYLALEDRDNSIKTLEHLTLGYKFDEYYPKLKEQFSKAQWTEYFSVFREKAQNSPVWLKFISKEKMEPEIAEECKKDTSLIYSNYKHLNKHTYGAEIRKMFETDITENAARMTKRKEYAELRWNLNAFKQACGEDAASELRQALLDRYKNKRAFCEEISKR